MPVDAPVDARARNRNHHHAGRQLFAAPVLGRFSERVPQQQLLERHRFGERRRGRPSARSAALARTARRSAARPPRARSPPRFARAGTSACIGPCDRPIARAARPTAATIACCSSREAPRRRDVDRFLEERTVERIGLVEDRQHVKRPVVQHPFDREFAPVNEVLDEHVVVRVEALAPDVRRLQDARAADRRRRSSSGRLSARMTPRLPESASGFTTHGKRDRPRAASGDRWPGAASRTTGPGRPARAQPLPRPLLVARHGRGFGAVPGQAKRLERRARR